ncbi:uncharacterized protein [Procambarus clarkii]|uniref:uncharacterized protein isoform X2 n=1 Tax=Procambarus clarkii TaxID=6728 RepID=UPI0037434C8D
MTFKLNMKQIAKGVASCQTHGLGGALGASAFLHITSDMVAITTNSCVQSRTSAAINGGHGPHQQPCRLSTFAPLPAGLSTSSPLSRNNLLDSKVTCNSKIMEDDGTEVVWSDTRPGASTQQLDGGAGRPGETGAEEMYARSTLCKHIPKANMEQQRSKIRGNSFDMNVSRKAISGSDDVEGRAEGRNSSAGPPNGFNNNKEEHSYEDAEALTNDNAGRKLCSHTTTRTQLNKETQKHVCCVAEDEDRPGGEGLQNALNVAEHKQTFPKRKVAPQKPPRRSRDETSRPPDTGPLVEARQAVQVAVSGDGMNDYYENNKLALSDQPEKPRITSSISDRITAKIEKYYLGRALKLSCKQRVCSFSLPGYRETVANPYQEVFWRKTRSRSPSNRLDKEVKIRENRKP